MSVSGSFQSSRRFLWSLEHKQLGCSACLRRRWTETSGLQQCGQQTTSQSSSQADNEETTMHFWWIYRGPMFIYRLLHLSFICLLLPLVLSAVGSFLWWRWTERPCRTSQFMRTQASSATWCCKTGALCLCNHSNTLYFLAVRHLLHLFQVNFKKNRFAELKKKHVIFKWGVVRRCRLSSPLLSSPRFSSLSFF